MNTAKPNVEVVFKAAEYGSSVKIDEVEVQEIRNVSVHHRAGHQPKVKLELNGWKGDPLFRGPAEHISVKVVALPGYRIFEKTVDGITTWWTEPESRT